MMRSLYSAVSGLNCNQKSMDVIGNNIANVNTIGYKTGRAVFQDMLSQTLTTGKTPTDGIGGINPRQVGTGAYLVSVDNIFTQGTIKTTARPHDLAIDGEGFFVVRGTDRQQYYTRAGDVNFDRAGYLTTPSGYKVQGWMADPVTGKLEYNTVASDIYLSDAHKTMQAKATSTIEFGGVLNTSAQASIWDFQELKTQASAMQSIFGLQGYQGNNLDLTETDTVTVKAHATGATNLADMYNKSGNSLGMVVNSGTVRMEIGTKTLTLTYGTTDAYAHPNLTGTFSSMDGFVNAVNNYLAGEGIPGQLSLEEGKIVMSSTGAFDFKSISATNNFLSDLLSPLEGIYSGQRRETSEMFFQKDLLAKSDFETLEELANRIDGAIGGNVIRPNGTAAFEAKYLDNNFGLSAGATFNVNIDGNALTFTFVGEDMSAADTAMGQFRTVKELADCIRMNSNNKFDAEIVNGKIEIKYVGNATSASITFSSVASSPYLDAILSDVNGYVFTPASPSFVMDSISGKGRIAYSVNGTTDRLTGFSVSKRTSGSIFDNTIIMGNDPDNSGVSLGSAGATTSYQFLTYANEDTKMIDTFNKNGDPTNFVENSSSLEFKASVGGTQLATTPFDINFTSTISDMMWSMEEYLGLGSDFNLKRNVTITDGKISVVGEKGLANKIDSLILTGYPTRDLAAFNNTFGKPAVSQAAEGGQFVSNMSIFDEQGNEHFVQFEFSLFNEEQNEWAIRLHSEDPDVNLNINGVTTNELIMRFNANGTPAYLYDRFSNPINVIAEPTLNFDPGNGTNTVRNIKMDFGTASKADGLILSASAFDINKNTQDGYALGALEDKLFSEGGEIVGVYTNGQIRVIGILALATFANNQGLAKVGDSLFAQTSNSGEATIGTAMSGARGKIQSASLEQSNVDLSSEFVDMIVTQRGYQANSRVITTSDEMIQELLNLKR